jgi:hypothetical protein
MVYPDPNRCTGIHGWCTLIQNKRPKFLSINDVVLFRLLTLE